MRRINSYFLPQFFKLTNPTGIIKGRGYTLKGSDGGINKGVGTPYKGFGGICREPRAGYKVISG